MYGACGLLRSGVGRSLARQCSTFSRNGIGQLMKLPREIHPLMGVTEFQQPKNPRLENIKLTAEFLTKTLDCPSFLPKALDNPNVRKSPTLQDPSSKKSEIRESPESSPIEKLAHRMLRIKKRKMKVHQRKKRWRKNKVFYQTRIFNRIKARELVFRTTLLEKIRSAERFDPQEYVKDYLEDYKKPLTPLTYKGRRLPVWLIKELLIKDELDKKRELDLQLSILSKKKLVLNGEKVQEFESRMKKDLDPYRL